MREVSGVFKDFRYMGGNVKNSEMTKSGLYNGIVMKPNNRNDCCDNGFQRKLWGPFFVVLLDSILSRQSLLMCGEQ